MDILLVAQYFGDLENISNSNNRFVYLASLLARTNKVEVLTTSFIHAHKKHGKNIPNSYKEFKITALPEMGYKKNISFSRFFSHKLLSNNMKKYMKTRKRPDVIYCAIPSLDCAYVMAKYARKNNVPFIIDIQDLWPEAFQMVFCVPIIKNIIFKPMEKKANYIYRTANHIIGVSNTYCSRAKAVNEKVECTSVYIGTNIEDFDRNVKENKIKRATDKILIGYCGTLGHSYDLKCVFDALEEAYLRGYDNIELWVMGRGPLSEKFRRYAEERKLCVKFWGWVPYEQMCGILAACDICVNPITKGSRASIINKHADYAASALPIINTQESKEYRNLIEKYECGINCSCGDYEELAEAIVFLSSNEHVRKQMGANARLMAEGEFNRKNTYDKLLNIVNSYAVNKNK